MSRMSKYLKQTCSVTPFVLNELTGKPQLNKFGEIEYDEPVTRPCRHEIVIKDIETANGQLITSTSRYFLDESYPLKAEYLLDGEPIVSIETYINEMGRIEGYEAYV